MTKFRLFSDTHYYHNKYHNEQYTHEVFSQLNDGFDGVNLIAGDVGASAEEVKDFCDTFLPKQRCIIIGGNHFMYGYHKTYSAINEHYKKIITKDSAFVFADRESFECTARDGDYDTNCPIVFAATLWSNFLSSGVENQEKAMRNAEYGVSDFRCRYYDAGDVYGKQILTPYEMWKECEYTLADIKIAYIRAKLQQRPFILMTHFPVTVKSTSKKFINSPLSPYFCNNLEQWIIDNIPETAFILQGHQHNRWKGFIEDKQKHVKIPVYQNPFGYVSQNEDYQKPLWNPKLIVEA